MKEKACCFFGHRKIEVTDKLKNDLYSIIRSLIVDNNIDTFLFGSKSQFDELCLEIVSDLKKQYKNIKRVYFRAEFPNISDEYNSYLLKNYDETIFPEKLLNAGKAAYVERNLEMINNSEYCIVYYDENYIPDDTKKKNREITYKRKSGTKIAYELAVKKKKTIINVYDI